MLTPSLNKQTNKQSIPSEKKGSWIILNIQSLSRIRTLDFYFEEKKSPAKNKDHSSIPKKKKLNEIFTFFDYS